MDGAFHVIFVQGSRDKTMARSTLDPDHSRASGSRSTIVGQLEKDIIFGRLHPNQRLIEDDLIERFEATRHTVRRAIDELVRLGLAIHQPNKGAYVRDYTIQEVEELYEIRDTLQTQAIRRMPLPLDAESLADMQAYHEQHQTAGEAERVDAVFQLNNAFHETFFRQCGNDSLAEAIRAYAWRTHPIRSRGFLDPDYREKAQAEHAAMIEAARSGARERLIELNSRHIQRPKELYIRARRLLSA